MSFNFIILLMLLSTNISSGKHTDYEKSIMDAISGLNRNLHNDINKKHFVRSGNGCLFVKFDGYALYGHNDETMLDLSLEECKDMCQYQIHRECQSIDYIETDRYVYGPVNYVYIYICMIYIYQDYISPKIYMWLILQNL